MVLAFLFLEEYISQGIDLLLTCDTGIAAIQAVQLAHQVQLTSNYH